MNIKKYFKYLIVLLIIYCVAFMFIFFYFLYPLKYKNDILNNAKLNNLKPEVIASIINVESSFNKNAISSKGAIGLMQLLPSTAKWVCEKQGIDYSLNNLTNPSFNIKIGSYYLRYLINKFNNLNTAIVAYNAGEGVTKSWLSSKEYGTDKNELKIIPYKETRDYLKKVNNSIKIYSIRF